MISNYNSFSLDLLLEKAINESFLYYSPNVRKALSRIKDNDIATELLSSEGTDVKPDMTFIDLGKEGYLSFITMRNAKPLINARYPNLDWAEKIETESMPDFKDYSNELYELDTETETRGSGVFKKSRNEVGLGRFVNKLFPGKYNSKEVEQFVNSFKASLEKAGEHFDLVEGEDIEHWYWYENYKEKSGTLGSSCMAQKRNLFGIYTQNQDVCKMLILKEDDKILGRALIWKLESIKHLGRPVEGVEYFMDRQYTILDSDVQKFRNYAKEQGWCYKSYNNHHSYSTVTIEGEEKNVGMTIQVKDKDYNRYPYMDTFRRYNPETGLLYNDDDEDDNEGHYILDDTGGGYTEIESGVWSEWHDRRIPEDEAVYSEPYGDHLLRDYAVRVDVGSSRRRGWYHQDDDDIVYDEHSDEYVHVDDAVYSDVYGNWIWDERAVKAITEIHSDGDVDSFDSQWYYVNDRDIVKIVGTERISRMTWYKKLCEKYNDWDDYDYINKDILTKNYNYDWIPDILERTIYKVGEAKSSDSPDIHGIEYLLEEDAIALEYEINMNDSRVIDIIQYNEDIDEALESILNKLNIKIQQLTDILDDKGQKRLVFDEDDEYEYRRKVGSLKDKLMLRYEELDSEEWHNL